jgi:hypothetical protein
MNSPRNQSLPPVPEPTEGLPLAGRSLARASLTRSGTSVREPMHVSPPFWTQSVPRETAEEIESEPTTSHEAADRTGPISSDRS